MRIIVKCHFDAAHFIPGYKGDCSRLHGHTWGVEIEVEGMVDETTGFIADFKLLKAILKESLPDHRALNDYWPEIKPTAENLVAKIYQVLTPRIPGLKKVRLWESQDAGVEFP